MMSASGWFVLLVIYSTNAITFKMNKFQIIINDAECNNQFCLRAYNEEQLDFPVFSLKQYYANSKIPFIMLSQATLSTLPVLNGEPQDFMNSQTIYRTSTDISIDHFYQNDSSLCVHIEGIILFTDTNKSFDSPYTFSLCPPSRSQPYYNNNTLIPSQNALDWDITIPQSNSNIALNRMFFTYDSESDEALLGFGVQYSFLNFKGKKLPIFTSEQGIGRGLEPITAFLNEIGGGAGGSWYTTYSSMPLYISTLNRSLLLYNYDISVFDMANDEYIQIEVYTNDTLLFMNGRIIYGDTPLKLIEELTLITGRMDPLPQWSQQGGILGVEGGTESVLKNVKKVVEYGSDLSMIGVWIQDWSGTITREIEGTRLLWNWELNSIKYPGWNAMVADLRSQYGIDHMLTYVNAYFVNISDISFDADKYGFQHNYYDDADHYFITDHKHQPYLIKSPPFKFATMDFTKAAAVEWFQQEIIKDNMLNASKASGFMTDFGEYIPFDSYLSDGEKCRSSFHNYYPLLYAKTVRDAVGDEIIAFHRISNLLSTKYTRLYWLGDQLVTWDAHDGIKSVLYGLFNGGISGHSLSHSDIGGYTMIDNLMFKYVRDCELLMRWMELSAFSDSMYRSHPGNEPSKSCQVYSNNETIAHWYRFSGIFKALSEYRKELMHDDAYKYGYPLVRHLYLHYYDDVNIRNVVTMKKRLDDDDYHRNRNSSYSVINEEFLLGDCMLVAPILYPTVTSRRVYLPKGEWRNYWNQDETITSEGEFYERDGPMGQPPVFVCPQWQYPLAF